MTSSQKPTSKIRQMKLHQVLFASWLACPMGLRMGQFDRQTWSTQSEMEQMWSTESERNDLKQFLDDLTHLDEDIREFVRWRWSPDDSLNLARHYIADPDINQIGQCTATMMHAFEENATMETQSLKSVPRFYFQDSRIESLMDTLDHIYVICGRCSRTFPKSLLKKVSFLSYKKLNACLQISKSGDHRQQCAASHRAAIMHAKQNQYKAVAVFEEDAEFDTDTSQMDLTSVEELIQSRDKPWEVVRLGWWFKRGSAVCECGQWRAPNMCTFDHGTYDTRASFCKLHTANGYIMSQRAFDKYLAPTPHAVDGAMLNQFQQTIIFPALVHEAISDWKGRAARASEQRFVKEFVK